MAASEFDRTIPGFQEFLRDINKLGPAFSQELRKSAIDVAKHVVAKAQGAASTRQEQLAAKGLEARPDRIPKIRVKSSRSYVSSSRPNARRRPAAKVKVIDIWFGTEFGGGKYGAGNKTPRKSFIDGTTQGGGYTTQFRSWRGTQGYFFYPTVRDEAATINEMYAKGVDRAMKTMFRDTVQTGAARGIAGLMS